MTYFAPLFRHSARKNFVFILIALSLVLPNITSGQTTATPTQSQTPDQQKQQQQQQNPSAGGPQGDIGPMAVPKKKTEEKPPEKPEKVKNPAGLEDYSLRVNVPLVTVDVSVLTKDGQFIPGLKQGNFRVVEDGVPQKVANFAVTEAPITAVLLVEFANTNYAFI